MPYKIAKKSVEQLHNIRLIQESRANSISHRLYVLLSWAVCNLPCSRYGTVHVQLYLLIYWLAACVEFSDVRIDAGELCLSSYAPMGHLSDKFQGLTREMT